MGDETQDTQEFRQNSSMQLNSEQKKSMFLARGEMGWSKKGKQKTVTERYFDFSIEYYSQTV